MNENLVNNLISLRKQRNISTNELAMVLGMSEDEYMKFEYGIENPTLDVLKKLGNFYGVEPADFFIIRQANVSRNGAQVGNANAVMKQKYIPADKYTHSLALSIVLLVLAAAFFIVAIMPCYTGSIRISGFGYTPDYWESVSVSFYSLISSAGALYVIIMVLLILVALWDVVDNILIMSCRWARGTYSKVSKILKLVTAILVTVLFTILTIGIISSSSSLAGMADVSISFGLGWWIMLIGVIAALVVKIISFVKTKRIA